MDEFDEAAKAMLRVKAADRREDLVLGRIAAQGDAKAARAAFRAYTTGDGDTPPPGMRGEDDFVKDFGPSE